MRSKSLVSSWTASFVPSGTRAPDSLHKACPGKLSVYHRRPSVIKHLHGLWKVMGVSSPRKSQLASDPVTVPRQDSSTINIPDAMLVSRFSPNPSPLITFPPSPTTPTPASLPSGDVDTGLSTVEAFEVEAGSMPFRSFKSLSPILPHTNAERSPVSRRQLVALSSHYTLPRTASTSPSPCAHGSVLNAATRLQDFRALVAGMRATLFHYDSKEEFDTGNCDDDERERLLRLLEDVMRKVEQLAEKDSGFVHPVSEMDTSP